MTKPGEKPPFFDLCAGHAVLDFVNSLDHRFRKEGPKDWLAGYGDLLRLVEETGIVAPAQARRLAQAVRPDQGARALLSARELREAIAGIGYAMVDGRAPNPGDVRVLERHFHNASQHRELSWHRPRKDEGAGLEWAWGGFETDAQFPVWVLAGAAVELLASGRMIKACGADNCRWLFLDTSKNHTRRWCSMSVCGNRAKARRFQARES